MIKGSAVDRASTPRSLSVVMPAHNEEGYLTAAVTTVVDGLRDRRWPFEVVICENGSTDRTAAIATELVDRFGEVRAIRLTSADYGAALRAGFAATTGELVANLDVDLVDLGFVDGAVRLMGGDEDTAVVVGTKRGAGADDQRTAARRVVTTVFSGMMRVGFGLQASDTHGLKLLRRASVAPLVAACTSAADLFDTELILRAERAGLRIAEIPVTTVEVRPARSPIASRIPRTLAGLGRLRLRLWLPVGLAPPVSALGAPRELPPTPGEPPLLPSAPMGAEEPGAEGVEPRQDALTALAERVDAASAAVLAGLERSDEQLDSRMESLRTAVADIGRQLHEAAGHDPGVTAEHLASLTSAQSEMAARVGRIEASTDAQSEALTALAAAVDRLSEAAPPPAPPAAAPELARIEEGLERLVAAVDALRRRIQLRGRAGQIDEASLAAVADAVAARLAPGSRRTRGPRAEP